MKVAPLLYLLLLCPVVSLAQQSRWEDTSMIKKEIDRSICTAKTTPEQDSLISSAITLTEKANLPLWKLRLLNYRSQQKVAHNEIPAGHTLIHEAMNVAEKDRDISNTVDYRDAIVQLCLAEFY